MNPKEALPLFSLASLMRDIIAATTGAEALVPPLPEQPPQVHRGIPKAASAETSGYPLP